MKLILAGAAPDTGNLGVSALCHATVAEILRIAPETEFVILDNGDGVRRGKFTATNGTQCTLAGARNSRRYWRGDSYANIRLGVRLGGLGAVAREIRSANAILDISGGDSFTDLYGPARLQSIMYPKQIALENGVPLVLLPQTYGPFEHPQSRAMAEHVVRGATRAYARDEYSFEVLRQLAGNTFTSERYVAGVDVAFLLPAVQPPELPPAVEVKLAEPAITVAGLNVSGLIYNDPSRARSQYGLSLDYRRVMRDLVIGTLETGADAVWLIPHVMTPPGHYESDLTAASDLRAGLDPLHRERVHVLDHQYNQSEVKWVIARCDWFCGMRMHATIAALSSGVPTAALAYSGKTVGVFATAGVADSVVDARREDTAAAADQLLERWRSRDAMRKRLSASVGVVVAAAREQMSSIVKVAL
jgi:polysaccharide pyruvyl transferase WcaK-like protein